MQRQREFRLNQQHPLAQGLLFAALGQFAGGTVCRDSSPYHADGALTNAEIPATATSGWTYDADRWGIYFDGSNDLVSAGFLPPADCTFSYWLRPVAQTTGYPRLFDNGNNGLTQQLENSSRKLVAGSGTLAYSASALTWGSLYHVLCRRTAANKNQWYINGVADGALSSVDAFGVNGTAKLGNRAAADRPYKGWMGDFLLWSGDMTSFAPALADPGNTDLRIGGMPLILPLRRLHPVAATTSAAGNRRRRLLLCGGYR